MLIKIGESLEIQRDSIKDSPVFPLDQDLLNKIAETSANFKKIAPRAEDFLYFAAVMMHSAEACLLDDDGKIKKDASGNDVVGAWEPTNNGGIRWVCSDPSINVYKNKNADIFPEFELIKAHKKWVGKPLCLDHKSSSVDMVRGIIIDTFYDNSKKRVIALCALDKKNYPDLADKVKTGTCADVSMGTGVGRAVCTESGCHRVARSESDFCQHMLSKSGYGEINLDLNPIELSIVVNGADTKAKIKYVMAKDLNKAADEMSKYIESKLSCGKVYNKDILDIKDSLNQLVLKVASLEDDSNDISDTAPYGATSGSLDMKESELSELNQAYSMPEAVLSIASEIEELTNKVSHLRNEFIKLNELNKKTTGSDSVARKKAYYQGAGGVNEPTPGRTKYAPDPLNEKTRMLDKQMVGQKPFPDVGPINGMHPGVASRPGGEAKLKKDLQRLAHRKMAREAAGEVARQKVGYWQGGGGANEPTPGKTKYAPEPLNEKNRTLDKQMVGKSPFPNVGPVNGLMGDDLKKKQMLARASLRGKFLKGATQDKSVWNVFAGDEVILTVSAADIVGKNASSLVYDAIATEKFGKDLLKNVRAHGAEGALALIKKAQAPDLMAPEMLEDPSAMPQPDMGAPEAPESLPLGDEMGGTVDDMVSGLNEALNDAENYASDLAEAAGAVGAEEVDALPDLDEANLGMATAASRKNVTLGMKKILNKGLKASIKHNLDKVASIKEEMLLLKDIFKKASSLQKTELDFVVKSAYSTLVAAESVFADSEMLKRSFMKYAVSSVNLGKKAQDITDEMRDAGTTPWVMPDDVSADLKEISDALEVEKTNPFEAPKAPAATGDALQADDEAFTQEEAEQVAEELRKALNVEESVGYETPAVDVAKDTGSNTGVDNAGAVDGVALNVPSETKVSDLPQNATFASKEARAAERARLSKRAMEYSKILHDAHPKGGADVTGLDSKPADQGNRVEDTIEQQNKMLQLAKAPPAVRKQAEKINALISEGRITASDVDTLVAHGVDADAVKYWKQYFGESKDSQSSDFANKLVEEKNRKNAEAAKVADRIKIKRAFELSSEMVEKGFITKAQQDEQVNAILEWNDDAFASLKKMVSMADKKASSLPEVGLMTSENIALGSARETFGKKASLTDLFNAHFNDPGYKGRNF